MPRASFSESQELNSKILHEYTEELPGYSLTSNCSPLIAAKSEKELFLDQVSSERYARFLTEALPGSIDSGNRQICVQKTLLHYRAKDLLLMRKVVKNFLGVFESEEIRSDQP
jgi:hypothetical protein